MSHLEREKRISEFWEKNKIFEKSVEQRPVTKQYVFYDGPPFATGTPHYGHILGLTSKDVFPRYWTMKGFRCERRWGWDCHGLPIENIAEKALGIKRKKEIEEYGIKKFNAFCRSKVLSYVSEWKKTVIRLGKWIEFDNSYKTMDKTYMETIWWIFKKLYNEGYIYEGKKILMYCPRCETPIAKAEIAMDNSYKEVTEKSVIAKFKVKGEDKYILAWTTTPWTLIGNVALAVNSKMDYVEIENNGERLIVAKDRLDEIEGDYKVIKEFKGKELLGLEYEPLYKTAEGKAYIVIDGGQEVSNEEGTGIVHMALYGEFDYEMIKKYKLAQVQHIDEHGNVVKGPKEFIGKFFKDVDKDVIEDLEDRNLLYKVKNYTHPYPFCYRCKTPLFYNAVDSWFVDIQKIKPMLLKEAKKIHWHPEEGTKKRFENNIKAAPDWTISRNRFWATAIPVWKCKKCGAIEVIGSRKELKEKAIEKIDEDIDLHKDAVDEIHLKCPKCGSKMDRIPEVIDCWFESGSMPYASKHYPFENKDWFKTNFPSDFISEYIGQIRAWFYYMHVMGVLIFGKPAYRHVVVTGNILAEDGQKMSKSLKNYPEPTLIFDKFGADALRFYLMDSPVIRAQDLNFREDGVKEIYRKVVLLLENISNFYFMFDNNNKEFNYNSSTEIMDRWIVSRTNSLIEKVTSLMDDYNIQEACDSIVSFIDELSTWYIRRSRARFKKGDNKAIKTLAYVLMNLIKVMAPITPFITEDIYQRFKEKNKELYESVHLDMWPNAQKEKIDIALEDEMKEVREIISSALDERAKAKIPIRQPLPRITIYGTKVGKEFYDIIKEELNVKEVVVKEGEKKIELDTTITPELEREGIARTIIRKVNSMRKENKLTIKDRIVLYVNTKDDKIKQALEEHKKTVMENIQADKIEYKQPKKGKEFNINGIKVSIGLEIK